MIKNEWKRKLCLPFSFIRPLFHNYSSFKLILRFLAEFLNNGIFSILSW